MKKTIFGFLLALCSACVQEKAQVSPQGEFYFNLENYFKAEAGRLTETKPQLHKTVMVNGELETRNVTINDWEQEFESFIDADINKAAWRGAFKITKDHDTTTYMTNDLKIPVKKVEVIAKGGKIQAVAIFIVTNNKLYTSSDSLYYYPDSLYKIKKTQKIRLMQEKHYEVTSTFK